MGRSVKEVLGDKLGRGGGGKSWAMGGRHAVVLGLTSSTLLARGRVRGGPGSLLGVGHAGQSLAILKGQAGKAA